MPSEDVGLADMDCGRRHAEFVPAAFAADLAGAMDLKVRLQRQNVPVLIEEDAHCTPRYTSLARGVPVLVPAQLHDRASEVLARHESAKHLAFSYDQDDDDDLDIMEDDDDDDDDDEEFDDDFDDLDDDYDDDDDLDDDDAD